MPRRRIFYQYGQPIEWRIPIRHCQQKDDWDCGLACIAMILPDIKRSHYLQNIRAICKEDGFNKSTWTIDLCFILDRYGIKFKFFTKILGVHKAYKQNAYYESVFSNDEQRINEKFKSALRRNMNVYQATIDLNVIIKHLSVGPVIILTNAKLLTCTRCKRNQLGSDFKRYLTIFHSYQGHYIVLCGYNLLKQIVYYRNPAMFDHVCSMNLNLFDCARSAFGTDYDVILIN